MVRKLARNDITIEERLARSEILAAESEPDGAGRPEPFIMQVWWPLRLPHGAPGQDAWLHHIMRCVPRLMSVCVLRGPRTSATAPAACIPGVCEAAKRARPLKD